MINYESYKDIIKNIKEISASRNLNKLIETIEADSLPFRNKAFPFYPVPIPLSEESVKSYAIITERYVRLLRKVIRLYYDHEIIRKFFGCSESEDRLIRNSILKEHDSFFSRLDGYIDDTTGRIKVLENNSDAPAGTLFTPRINGMSIRFLEILNKSDFISKVSTFTFLKQETMLTALTRAYTEKYSRNPEVVVIFQLRNKSNKESKELALMGTGALKILVVDPRDVEYKLNGVYTSDGDRIDIVWNKINTVYWNNLVTAHPELLSLWNHVISSDTDLLHFNPFCYRYLTENKLFASLLYEKDFEHFFTKEELTIRNTLIPKSVRLKARDILHANENESNLITFVQKNQADLVLKEPFDIRGDGVTIGLDCDEKTWEKKLVEIIEKGGIIQEYIKPKQLPFFNDFHQLGLKHMNFHVDTFIFGEKLLGFGAKASTNNKVNIFQGGIKVPVIVFK